MKTPTPPEATARLIIDFIADDSDPQDVLDIIKLEMDSYAWIVTRSEYITIETKPADD